MERLLDEQYAAIAVSVSASAAASVIANCC